MQQVTLPKRTLVTNGTDTFELDTEWFIQHLLKGPLDLINWLYEFDMLFEINGMLFKSTESKVDFADYDKNAAFFIEQLYDTHVQRHNFSFDPEEVFDPTATWGSSEAQIAKNYPSDVQITDFRIVPEKRFLESYSLAREWKARHPGVDVKTIPFFDGMPKPETSRASLMSATEKVTCEELVFAIEDKTKHSVFQPLCNPISEDLVDTVYDFCLGYAILDGHIALT